MKIVTIPAADDLLARLIAIDDNPHQVKRFYPYLLKAAGVELAGQGIATKLALAAYDYTSGLPLTVSAVVNVSLHRFVPAFTDDPEVQAAALDHFEAVGLPTGRTT